MDSDKFKIKYDYWDGKKFTKKISTIAKAEKISLNDLKEAVSKNIERSLN
jgi:hypothetical protein